MRISVLACFETLSYKNFLRNKRFAKFTGKHLCQSLFFNKGAGLPYFPAFGMNKGRHGVIRIVSLRIQSECGKIRQACNFITKETLLQMFSCEFCKISKSSFFTEHLRTTSFWCLTWFWIYMWNPVYSSIYVLKTRIKINCRIKV